MRQAESVIVLVAGPSLVTALSEILAALDDACLSLPPRPGSWRGGAAYLPKAIHPSRHEIRE